MTTIPRFLERVDQAGPGGCWLWLGSVLADGYGQARHGKDTRAHRVAHEIFIGPIPGGLVVDHLCGVKTCVNPAHLEAVTQAENVRRANAHRTHCPHGHAYSGANVYIRPGSNTRACRACHNIQARRRTRERRQARLDAAAQIIGERLTDFMGRAS